MNNLPPGTIEHVRRCLLAMLGGQPHLSLKTCAQLGKADWPLLENMAGQHRLEPLLHEATRGLRDASAIPAQIRDGWAAAFHDSALQALAAQATLGRLNDIMARASIAYAALKGARLAWHAYPHPALRPMRDIDILVSPNRATEAYRALVAQGFEALAESTTPFDIALRDHKHLPALRDPATGIHVEVHLRLFEYLGMAQAGALLANPEALLASRVWLPLGQAQIAYLPPAETLLHLIVHSVHEHRFDNGPQVLHDIAALLAADAIDWRRFWDLAREGGWERGCLLLLRLTEQFLGRQPIEWFNLPTPPLSRDIIDNALLLMLQDTELRQDFAVQVQFASGGGDAWAKAKGLLGRVLVKKHIIAAHAGVPPENSSVWFHYPSWLLSRFTRTLRGAVNQRQKADVARAIDVEKWLSGG